MEKKPTAMDYFLSQKGDELDGRFLLLPIEQVVAESRRIVEMLGCSDVSKWIPFAQNGLGDVLCVEVGDTSGKYPVMYFRHELANSVLVSNSFVDWVSDVSSGM